VREKKEKKQILEEIKLPKCCNRERKKERVPKEVYA